MSTDKDKTDASIRKALADEIAEKQKRDNDERQAKMREALNNERVARRAETDMTNRREADRLWAISNDNAQRLIDSGAEAYADYIASNQAIVKSLITLVDAMGVRMPIPKLLRDVGIRPLRQIIDSGIDKAVDGVSNLFSSDPGAAPIPMPTLQHNIEMGDDNKLNLFRESNPQMVDAAKVDVNRADNLELHPVHKEKIATHILYWLKKQGYEPGAETGTFKKTADDTLLTKEEFARLRDDPVNGLGASLTTKFGLNFEKKEDEDKDFDFPTPD